jgi:hypothetical protein
LPGRQGRPRSRSPPRSRPQQAAASRRAQPSPRKRWAEGWPPASSRRRQARCPGSDALDIAGRPCDFPSVWLCCCVFGPPSKGGGFSFSCGRARARKGPGPLDPGLALATYARRAPKSTCRPCRSPSVAASGKVVDAKLRVTLGLGLVSRALGPSPELGVEFPLVLRSPALDSGLVPCCFDGVHRMGVAGLVGRARTAAGLVEVIVRTLLHNPN